MIDHRSYAHNLSSCEIKAAWKKIQAWRGFETMTYAILVQCSTNWAIKPSGSLVLCEFVTVPVQAEEYKWIYEIHIFELRRKIWRYDWLS